MKNRILLYSAVAVVIVSSAAGGAYYHFRGWLPVQPTVEVFDPIMHRIWEKEIGRREHFIFRPSPEPLCIGIPRHPAPDAASKADHPMGWHADFLDSNAPAPARAEQLRKLAVLAKAGLLETLEVPLKVDDKVEYATRYRLSDKGWAASGYNRFGHCFVYGLPRYLGIAEFKPRVVSHDAGLELYEVVGKTGIASEDELSDWARAPEIQAVLPEIAKNVGGKPFHAVLARGAGGWIDYRGSLRDAQASGAVSGGKAAPSLSPEARKRISELQALPAPSIAEVEAILLRMNGPTPDGEWSQSCLNLPGSEKLPVDRRLSGRSSDEYVIAMYTNKARSTYDRALKNTIPYLEQLVGLGVFVKQGRMRIAGEGREAGQIFEAETFALAAPYKYDTSARHPYCLKLGPPTIEFVDIQVADIDEDEPFAASFRYKLRVYFRNPPSWAKDPALLGSWAELRGVLDRGIACSGAFEFDKQTRSNAGGAGTCRWAFDTRT